MLSDDLAFADAIGKAYAVNNFSEGRFTLSKEGSDDVMLLRKYESRNIRSPEGHFGKDKDITIDMLNG